MTDTFNNLKLHAMQNVKILFVLSFFFTAFNLSAATCNSLGNGAWDNPLNWSCGVVPAPVDIINIMPGHTVTVSNNTNLTGAPVVINIYGVLLFDSPGAKHRHER
jgi:hypothetical protein